MTLEQWAARLETPEQKAIKKRLRIKMMIGCVLGALGALVFGVILLVMAYAFLACTPSQRSAEADLVAEQLEKLCK